MIEGSGSVPQTYRSGSRRHSVGRFRSQEVKDKKPQRSHKTVGINVFLTFFARRIRIRSSDSWIRIREAQKHMDPRETDPQHCFFVSPLRCASQMPADTCFYILYLAGFEPIWSRLELDPGIPPLLSLPFLSPALRNADLSFFRQQIRIILPSGVKMRAKMQLH